MLCESLLHVLVEEGVISHAKAIESIEGVAEILCEMAVRDRNSKRLDQQRDNRMSMPRPEWASSSS